jgi:hypothetical protein
VCPTPKPISEFGQRVMLHLVNQQIDLVNTEIERFRKKGYIVYYKAISREEYELSNFMLLSGKVINEAKENSKDMCYNGILGFFPFINKKNYPELFHSIKSPLSLKWEILLDWAMYFNEDKCLNNCKINMTDKVCNDTRIHVMVFYFKGGLNWE